MNRHAVLHIPMSPHAFCLDERRVVFRLRAARNDLAACTLIYGDRACRHTPVDYFEAAMAPVRSTPLFDWWEVTLDAPFTRLCYAFRLTGRDGEALLYYGDQFAGALTAERSEYFQLPFNHRAHRMDVPSWMRDAVVYNIFPDSFATGEGFIAGQGAELRWQGETVRGRLGGTLRGVTDNLPYIRDLGCNCIYLNPIFAAGAYHKYDVIDYFHIDPVLGTDEDFRTLVDTAHGMGLRVIIDGVFNHCGWRFFAFRDAVEKGGSSAYRDWFYRLPEPLTLPASPRDVPGYECFGYERMMPKLATDNPAVQDYFCRVGEYWVREYGIDGWRLDVANEVSDGFWRAFRRAVKAVKPDCALIGEVWETAAHWLDGSMFDSAMNYDLRRHCRDFFARDALDAQGFDGRVTDMLMRYRSQTAFAQLNLLDSHDVSRFLSLCGGDTRRMKLAVLFQMTFAGMPCVFYGDERGMAGVTEEEYRSPMPWDADGGELLPFCRRAIALRHAYPALRRGAFRTVFAQKGGGVYHYLREAEEGAVGVIMNRAAEDAAVCAPGEILWQENAGRDILGAYGFIVYRA
ncbi:MAG: glycoside hydrolase family 13 protein [Aristaeellaceae bacterium]